MTQTQANSVSPRKQELLESAYGYVLHHGLSSMSLRPLATAIGTSPRVLLFLFESKEQLVRELLARARRDELAVLDAARGPGPDGGLADIGARVWTWLSRPENQGLLRLWVDAYARSLVEPDGPWADFAAGTVQDWLDLLGHADGADRASATAVLAVLRGALLDLLATGDVERTTRAVRSALGRFA